MYYSTTQICPPKRVGVRARAKESGKEREKESGKEREKERERERQGVYVSLYLIRDRERKLERKCVVAIRCVCAFESDLVCACRV